jgi:hypothetical protein
MAYDTGGDPMSGIKWCRKTPARVAQELQKAGIDVGATTVRRLLRELMGYSLRVNHKKIESGNRNPPDPKLRDQQFERISSVREMFASRGDPIISVDTKKKELIGNFKNNGRAWLGEPEPVYDHDFPSDAVGRMIPFGIYDTQHNRGYICINKSAETPAFAVDSIQLWWCEQGRTLYPCSTELLILADCGGANSSRARAWKYRIQNQLCDGLGLTVTVCHYPPGASKWNPIEHRVFSEITKNWAGKPLRTFRTALHCIRRTQTTTGLQIAAKVVKRAYRKGEKISDTEMQTININRHEHLPDWNYTIAPASSKM